MNVLHIDIIIPYMRFKLLQGKKALVVFIKDLDHRY